MITERLKSLPGAVRDFLVSDEAAKASEQLVYDFDLNSEQIKYIDNCILEIVLKDRQSAELPGILEKMPGWQDYAVDNLALQIATDQLWPLQDYLGNVDSLITKLGGTVPRTRVALDLTDTNTASEQEENIQAGSLEPAETPAVLVAPAKKVINEYREYNDLYLTQKPIKDEDDRLRPPSVKNWLQDFFTTVGAANPGSLKRSHYLARSRNAANLNDAEKENLINFLASYEEDLPMYWQIAEDQYLLVMAQPPTASQDQPGGQNSARNSVPELWTRYTTIQKEYDEIIARHTDSLQAASEQNVKSLYDVVWDSLGLGQTDQCVAALALLIDRHAFWDMLKTDQRFKGIMNRYIDVRYGTTAKNTWNGDMTTAAVVALFWQLILKEKLRIEEGRAAILADMFCKKLEVTSRPTYLDLKAGAFLFRGVLYQDRTFIFED